MTTHNSVQTASLASQVSAGTPLNVNLSRGKLRMKYAKLAASGQTLAQNDLVKLFKLPKGAHPLLIREKHGAFGASVTLDVGTSATEDLFMAAQSISAASSTLQFVDTATPLTADLWIYAKLEGANPADDKDLEIWLFYAVE